MAAPTILLIDNYDSFTYNLEHYLLQHSVNVVTVRHDALDPASILQGCYHGVTISPGPGRPEDAGRLMETLQCLSSLPHLPVLGICLGMQAMGLHHGFTLKRAPFPVHGKQSQVRHTGQGVFKNLPLPVEVMRYHSLILHDIDKSIASISAWTAEDKLPMGLFFHHLPWQGVQFHPESIGTPTGLQMIGNWVNQVIVKP
jgi:anthranilate synthase/aminodeoxychorismate synthase-like glutamine amidotransferase